MSDLSFFYSPTAIAGTVTTLLLIGIDLFIVLRNTLFANLTLPRWSRFLPLLALVLMVAQVAANITFNIIFVLMAVPIYVATLLIAGGAFVRGSVWTVRWLFKRNPPVAVAHFSLPRAILALACGALVLLGAFRLAQTYLYAGS